MHPVVKVVVGAVLVLLLGGILTIAATLRLPADRYRFLEGRDPIDSGVYAYSGPWFELRLYSWQGDYESVIAVAETELKSLGFKPTVRYQDSFSFATSEASVSIERGRYESLSGKHIDDPSWVTVFTRKPPPNSWMTHVRLTLTPDS